MAAFAVGLLGFAIAIVVARGRRGRAGERDARRSRTSWIGIVVQGFAIVLTGFGPIDVTLDPVGWRALSDAALVAVLMGGAVALFAWATRTMGRNWSIVARTRADHGLVTAGPFAHVRHPIYDAMGLILFAVAVAYGHEARLLVGLPLFALGTWLRIREEERLLRSMFGDAYDGYAGRVKRFVPGLF